MTVLVEIVARALARRAEDGALSGDYAVNFEALAIAAIEALRTELDYQALIKAMWDLPPQIVNPFESQPNGRSNSNG